jgi:hypothetical protein
MATRSSAQEKAAPQRPDVHANKNKPTKEKERKNKAKEVNIKEKRTFPPYHFWSDFPKHYLHGIRERCCMCSFLSA